jgi:hypothetical protein
MVALFGAAGGLLTLHEARVRHREPLAAVSAPMTLQ